jgi:manganese transport protein
MIVVAFALEIFRGGLDPAGVVGGIVPRLAGPDSVLLAVGILGATVMPHIVYAHSALVRGRYPRVTEGERREALRAQRLDVGIALGLAGAVNLAILVLAAGIFEGSTGAGAGTLETTHAQLGAVLGPAAAALFGVALLASGLASTSVGTYAGEIIMAGFLRRRVSLTLRRLVTVVPALLVLALGVEPTLALVLSQAALSFGIPFALVPLVWFTSRRDVMGTLVNRRSTTAAAVVVTGLVVALNAGLLLRL